ncbi:protein-glutamate O-methyltransferase CheR [uncultured Clostridium sp.]|uniref:CheR family methyltransferase n=1 Tax=uncultured Clostridium sp. TaxID=59620 RepID=UPI0025D416B9|nr:protein-glutamate O-methyltransferase CheR [uncultured Clostridium sp.]
MNISEFKKWVFKEFNINLIAYKEVQLDRRILSLMNKCNIKDLEEYSKLLKNDKKQRQIFLDFITINVTEFFRNPELFDELKNEISKGIKNSSGTYKIWSAACSIGCEPYSLAMIVKEINTTKRINILATDLDTTILSKAKVGEYTNIEMKNMDSTMTNKYFKVEDGKYYINQNIKDMVTFKKHDLILDDYEKGFDCILCRNVVIYFKQEVKEEIYNKFAKSLKQGGIFFVGATESIYNYKNYGFEKVSTFIYRKI